MAASDVNNKGKRIDYAKHYAAIDGGYPVCEQSNYGYSTNNIEDVDCKKCIKLIKKGLKLFS